jgi:hypothetical protein
MLVALSRLQWPEQLLLLLLLLLLFVDAGLMSCRSTSRWWQVCCSCWRQAGQGHTHRTTAHAYSRQQQRPHHQVTLEYHVLASLTPCECACC